MSRVKSIIVVVVSVFLMATVIYAWTGPPSPPPGELGYECPAGDPGCDSPITVSSADQFKAGGLEIGGALKVTGSRIIRNIDVQVDTTTRSHTTSWGLGPTFNTVSGFKAGSLVRLTYHVPMRNDSTSWGGGYIEPQISFNGGSTWNSLGSSGYDGGVMDTGSATIGSYFNSILIDPAQASDFSVRVRFYYRSYDGTVTVNGSHDINAISGTATLMSGVNGLQHFTKVIVEELY